MTTSSPVPVVMVNDVAPNTHHANDDRNNQQEQPHPQNGDRSSTGSGGGSGSPPSSPSRLKAPPVCFDLHLMSKAMTSHDLSELTFPVPPGNTNAMECITTNETATTAEEGTGSKGTVAVLPSCSLVASTSSSSHHNVCTMPISSSSSTCTRESESLSDAEGHSHSNTTSSHVVNNCNIENSTTLHDTAAVAAAADLSTNIASLGGAIDNASACVSGSGDRARTPTPTPTTNVDADVDASSSSTSALAATRVDRLVSDRLNAKVSLQKTSRQGRSTQRWLVDSATNEPIRLVTGCVPILRDGKILFVSSSRQSEWILPKGGWEQDETLEESAVRECFEEAGVLGTLGSKLSDVQYETRKSKKRRLEQEELVRTKNHSNNSNSNNNSASGAKAARTSTDQQQASSLMPSPKANSLEGSPPHASTAPDTEGTNGGAATTSADVPSASATPLSLCWQPTTSAAPTANNPINNSNHIINNNSNHSFTSPISKEDLTRIRWLAQQNAPKPNDETLSIASSYVSSSNANPHSQVRMTLFPLYVTEVHNHWPESGRLRTAVDMDTAIQMMDSRPEFKVVLQEVKQRGLHQLKSPSLLCREDPTPTNGSGSCNNNNNIS